MAKNEDIRRLCEQDGIEWVEVASGLGIPMKDLVRRLNARTVTPCFRRRVLGVIRKLRSRSEFFYDEWR